jgi:Ca2+-binding EF-hand superfamily protein
MRQLILVVTFVMCACTHQDEETTNGYSLERVKKAYALYDIDHDGVISHSDWSALGDRAAGAVPEYGRAQYLSSWEQNFRRIDKSHDGTISFQEFLANSQPPRVPSASPDGVQRIPERH